MLYVGSVLSVATLRFFYLGGAKVDATFFVNALLLGIGLSMDAFSVAMANGLNEPTIKFRKGACISGVFAIFQFAMPLVGWALVSSLTNAFEIFEKCIPWIALILLCFIGGKMIYDSIKHAEDVKPTVKFSGLIVQSVATSIDALSVGLTIADYDVYSSLTASAIIGVITFVLCLLGVFIGKKAGGKMRSKAGIIGGLILIAIGLEIFIKSLL